MMTPLHQPKTAAKIKEFWNFFSQHEKKLAAQEEHDVHIISQLLIRLSNFETGVLIEIGPCHAKGKRQFIFSADGDRAGFPLIEKIVAQAPELESWEIIAFRQPKPEVTSISLGSIDLNFSDVYFKDRQIKNKLALELHLKDYVDNDEYNFTTFIILDSVIGEYDTETMLGEITRRRLNPELTEDLKPLSHLPEVLARHKRQVFGLN